MKYPNIFPKDAELLKCIMHYYSQHTFQKHHFEEDVYTQVLLIKYLNSIKNIIALNKLQPFMEPEANNEMRRLRRYIDLTVYNSDNLLHVLVKKELKLKKLDMML